MGLSLRKSFKLASYQDLMFLATAFANAVRGEASRRTCLISLRGSQYHGKTAFAHQFAKALIDDDSALHDSCKPLEPGWDSTFWINRVSVAQGLQVRVKDSRAIFLVRDEFMKRVQGFRPFPAREFHGVDLVEHPWPVTRVHADATVHLKNKYDVGLADEAIISCPRWSLLAGCVSRFLRDESMLALSHS